MGKGILVFMMNIREIVKSSVFYLIICSLLLFKGNIIALIGNINTLINKPENPTSAELDILKTRIMTLKEEQEKLTHLQEYGSYEYDLTRLSYRESYKSGDFFIYGGSDKNYRKNFAVMNEWGLVGIINNVKEDYSEVTILPNVKNLSVRINEAYGTLCGYEDGLFIIEDISNYDKIDLNDLVYTSTLGTIKEKILIGSVYKIEDDTIESTLYVKSNVDFFDITYLYVVGDL